ncbi:MAG: glycoside hydrolase family 5 protein [Thalassotalea sp.]
MLSNNVYLRLISYGLSLALLSSCGSSGSPANKTSNNSTLPEVIIPAEPEVTLPIPLPVTTPYLLPDEISPEQAVAEMKIGINLGNTFDAPNEGDWALAAERSFIQAFKAAGFKHIRIPVTWHQHTEQTSPYQVDSAFLARVEQVVEWALAEDLYVILNAHHEAWLKEDFQNQKNQNRFDRIWLQIAEHFKEKPAKLMFEILNEPHGMTMADVNHINQGVLTIIRNQNPNRVVIFSGHGYTPIDALLTIDIPDVQDEFLIGNFHSYDPWAFAGQCQQSWGTNQDKLKLREIYQRASDWSIINQIPVMVNEFGAAKYDFTQTENVCDLSERLAYLAHHVSLASEYGIAGSFWDDGGSFSTFNRTNLTWGSEKDILVSANE